MKKVLCVAESNEAAKRIAELLAGGARASCVRMEEGRSKYNKLYNFRYQMQGQWCDMTMTSVSGHLLRTAFVDDFTNWQSIVPVKLFDAPVYKECSEKMKLIKETLEASAQSAQVLIIWTGCDRDGENIGFEIINVCRAVNPGLDVLRAKFSDITLSAMTRAMNNLGRPDERVSNAVNVRQEIDLKTGAAFTRLQTLRLQARFPAFRGKVVSYGSCQLPPVGFVVERYRSFQEFVPQKFWSIQVKHKKDKCLVNFEWERDSSFDQGSCAVIHKNLKKKPKAKVVKAETAEIFKKRPVALNAARLRKLASRKLKMSAKEVMQIAKRLYFAGIISYPGTSTNKFSEGFDHAAIVQQLTGSSRWGDFALNLLQTGQNPRNGRMSDQIHPPIHPIRAAEDKNLTDKEAEVYELIVRRYLSCCSKDAKGREVKVEIKIVDEIFKASGLTVLERNYLEVYPYSKWSDKELPKFQKGEKFIHPSIELKQGETSAPSLLTETDLKALMEKHGIGNYATHATHIETIKNRQYISENKEGRLVPSLLGMSLVEGYECMDLNVSMSKPDLLAELEADLKRICDGTLHPDVVLREQLAKYQKVFIQADSQFNRIESVVAKYIAVQPPPVPGPPGNQITERSLLITQPRSSTMACGVKRRRSSS